MIEVMDMLTKLSQEIKVIKMYLTHFKKSKTEVFKETWIDGQEVMQAIHVSKRTLQSLRDNGTIPYSRINGKFYYKVSDLEKLLESNYSHAKSRDHGNN